MIQPKLVAYGYQNLSGKFGLHFLACRFVHEIINQYFTLNSYKLPKISNNELSFYFVAGIEFGSRFKSEDFKTDNDTTQI